MKTRVALPRLVLVLTLGAIPPVLAQPVPVMTTSPIASGEGLFLVRTVIPTQTGQFPMNNLVVVRPGSVILVDTLPPGLYPLFINTVHGLTAGRPVDTLINSHWHFDHAGLNAEVRNGGATIIAHWRAGAYMTSEHCIEQFLCMPALPNAAQPTQLVRGEMTLVVPNETISIKSVENAHSGADLLVRLHNADVLYTGDVYFGGMYPIIDRTAGGTVNGMLHALNQVLAHAKDGTVVVPSHGPLGTRETVLEFSQMLKTSRDQVRALIEQGLTEQQVMMHQSFAEMDAKWGNGLIPGPLFRQIMYRDLAPAH